MPKVALNDLARALKNLETEVRKRRNYITVNEMLDLAESAGASEHGRLKSDVLSALSPNCVDFMPILFSRNWRDFIGGISDHPCCLHRAPTMVICAQEPA